MTMARTATTSSASRAALFLAFYYAMTTMTASSVLGFSSFNLHMNIDTPRWQPQHSFSISNRHDNDSQRASTSACRTITFTRRRPPHRRQQLASIFSSTQLQNNLYDDWSSDLLSTSQSEYSYDDLLLLPTNDDDGDIEESIVLCLEEMMDSEYGKTMFGRHDVPASVGITGSVEFVSLEGPEVILSLTGKFWHRRETVLGKAAMYLNARIPELTSIRVSSPDELADFEDIIDEYTGEVLYREDKRSPDFNGDRETMEYQGLDPDARGPFVFASSGSMIRPA